MFAKQNFLYRYWRSTVEKPKFWRWAIFKIDKENIEEVLSSRRLRIVTGASLECSGDISSSGLDSFQQFYIHISYMLRADVIKFQLKTLKISANLEEEKTRESLAEVICNVEQVDLSESDIKSAKLFEKISSYEDLRLKHLIMNDINIINFPKELVSETLRKIEEVNLSKSRLRYTQLNQLFEDLHFEEDSPLKRLDLSQNNFSYFFQQAGLCQLEEVRLCQVFITTHTLTRILSSIAKTPNLKLKHLDLSDNNLSKLPPATLAEAAVRLEKLSVSRTKLKPDQMTAVFSRLRERPASRLKSLNISNNRLASLPAGMLADVLCHLEEANVANTRLSTQQVTAIFSDLLNVVPLQLKSLNISNNNLSSLSLPTLRQAVTRLEQIHLISCSLNLHHVLSLNLQDFAQKYI